SALWKHGISGDLPIVLARIANASQIDLVRHLIQAHGYWQMRGLHADLLIWNEELSGYRQELQEHILYLIESGAEARGGQGKGKMVACATRSRAWSRTPMSSHPRSWRCANRRRRVMRCSHLPKTCGCRIQWAA